jgi:hypothetical protein
MKKPHPVTTGQGEVTFNSEGKNFSDRPSRKIFGLLKLVFRCIALLLSLFCPDFVSIDSLNIIDMVIQNFTG